jgi:glycosyltransferase involved in cell wall biosynthesis
MRIVQVTPTPFGAGGLFGGGERYPLELARALARRVPCRLVTYGRRARRIREPNGLEIDVLRRYRLVGGHPAHPVGPGLARATAGADIVHVHQLHSRTAQRALRAAVRRRQRRAVTDHGLAGKTRDAGEPVELFLTVSQYSADRLHAPADRTEVIFGGADPNRFFPDRGSRAGALFVGRLTPHKGVDRLITALPPGAELTVAGSGGHDPHPPESGYVELLHDLARASPGRVRFLSGVSEGDLSCLMRRSSVLVLPSVATTCYGRQVEISELLGLVVIEAMMSGTPVVASDVGGVAEVVADHETGFLVPPGDVDALRDRMTTVLTNQRLRTALGCRAREVAEQRFTWEACAQRCLRAYDDLLA